jgi:hypothetical protein
LPLDTSDKDLSLSEFQKNNLPPVYDAISIKSRGAVIKRRITKRVPDITSTINVSSVPLKKSKKIFDFDIK